MSGYIGVAPTPQATQTRQTFTATSGQTTFNTIGYQAGYLDVFLNGVKLVDGTDYTATNGSDVVLTTGAASGDTLEVVAYTAFTVADQAFTGDISIENLDVTGTFTSQGIDDNATSTAMTLDSSGNLLVGKTSADFGATAGAETRPDGRIAAGRAGETLVLNRLTSDGDIALFRKDGSTVGSIGVNSSDQLYISRAAGSQGIKFKNGGAIPCNADGSDSDNDQDLGISSVRFRNLYLSGGVYLGGTGSANKLDDYEQGTWTPTSGSSALGNLSIQKAQYTKIGRQVHLFAQFTSDSTTTVTLDNSVNISGLPFAVDSGSPKGIGGILQFYASHGQSKNALADMLISNGNLDCEIIVVRGSFAYASCLTICVNVTYNTTA